MPVLGSLMAEGVGVSIKKARWPGVLTWRAAVRVDVGEGGFLELCGIPDCYRFEGESELGQDDGNLDVHVSW